MRNAIIAAAFTGAAILAGLAGLENSSHAATGTPNDRFLSCVQQSGERAYCAATYLPGHQS